MLKVGDRVTVKCSTELYEKSSLNGHICEIIHIGTYNEHLNVDMYYDIKWLPEENVGKSCNIDPIDFYWFEHELILCPNFRAVKPITSSEGLPDF